MRAPGTDGMGGGPPAAGGPGPGTGQGRGAAKPARGPEPALRAARILAVANQKGGVGKTTTALSLGAALARRGRRVLVMDLDPHNCASAHLGFFPENVTRSVLDLFLAGQVDAAAFGAAVTRSGQAGFDFVPGHSRLSELDVDLRDRPRKGVILKEALASVSDRYDFAILDCPPHMGVLLANAMVASDLLIIPIQTDFLALHGLRLLFDSMRTMNRVLARPLAFMALATMYDRRAGACVRVLNLLRRKLGARVFSTVIGLDTQFREASADGKVIYEVAPDSRGAREYLQLADEILRS
ncbi:MAG: ParA family protein [Desulfovibrionaceae bacterium]|nr:ParA family protein [Desulfovibrionaceae bacterium]